MGMRTVSGPRSAAGFYAQYASTLAILSLLTLAGIIIYRAFFGPIARVPGPFLAKFSGRWRNTRYWRGTWHDDILEVHRKYGPVVRIAPNEVSVVDQQAVKLLFGHGHNAAKTNWYATWDPPDIAPAFFAVRDRKLHSFLRKRVSGAYSMSAILRYEPFIQGCLDLLLKRLREQVLAGQMVNMSDMTNAFAFDVVGELAYGTQLGHLETGTDVMDVRKNIYEFFYMSACMGHYLGQMKTFTNTFTQRMMSLLGVRNGFLDFQQWSVERVKKRYEATEKGGDSYEGRSDMLAHFLMMKDPNGNAVRFEEVLTEAMNLVGAGADTTSIAIRACLQAIASRKSVCGKLQAEIDDYYTTNQLTKPITYLQCQNLPYLLAVTREAMRLLPSIVFQLLRHAPPEGLTVDGKFIPPGTPVGVSPIAQNRDRHVWGDDADDFRPERWLESEEQTRHLESYNMTFGGSGPRMCVGRNIALVEVQKSIAQIFRHFDVEIVDEKKPWHISSYWFAYQHDFMVRLRAREEFPLMS